MSHCILISLGSNIDKVSNTRKGLDELYRLFGTIEVSTIYESEAVGFSGNTFINLVVMAHTDLSVSEVIERLKRIEIRCGRIVQDKKFCDRTLDLDLLTFDNIISQFPVVLPREEILENAFVLKPMADIVPERNHPVMQKSYQQLWCEYKKHQRLWPIELEWSPPRA